MLFYNILFLIFFNYKAENIKKISVNVKNTSLINECQFFISIMKMRTTKFHSNANCKAYLKAQFSNLLDT